MIPISCHAKIIKLNNYLRSNGDFSSADFLRKMVIFSEKNIDFDKKLRKWLDFGGSVFLRCELCEEFGTDIKIFNAYAAIDAATLHIN